MGFLISPHWLSSIRSINLCHIKILSSIRMLDLLLKGINLVKPQSSLIENALKYTYDGSVDIPVSQMNRKKPIIIKDTGIGISEEYLRNIYKPFSQESEGFTKSYLGIGLGMLLAKKYLNLDKLVITYDSGKGIGTTATITFPENSGGKYD